MRGKSTLYRHYFSEKLKNFSCFIETIDFIYGNNTHFELIHQLSFLGTLAENAQVLLDEKKRKTALSIYQQAIMLISKIRRKINEEALKEIFVRESDYIYEKAIGVCFQIAHIEPNCKENMHQLAFYFVEHEKVAILLDKIIKKTENKHILLQQMDKLEVFIQYENFDKVVVHQNDFLYNLQKQLSEKTAILYYYLTSSYLCIFSITNHKLEAIQISDIKGYYLKERVTSFVAKIKLPLLLPYLKEATNLYQLLMEKVARNFKGINELIIIPDEYLYTLPFVALVQTDKMNGINNLNNNSFNLLPYLIKDYEISYQDSAILLYKRLFLQKNKTKANKNFLAFAPTAFSTTAAKLPKLRRNVYFVNEIVKKINNNGFKTTFFKGKEATLDSFQRYASQYQYIFLATHGVGQIPYYQTSRIYFNDSWEQKNYLESVDIESLILNAKLLILCCCESGLNTFRHGYGMTGLHQSFILAGANNIIYSLSKVDEKNTGKLMLCFFEEYLKSGNLAKSLQTAQLCLIKQGKYPFFWANFALTER